MLALIASRIFNPASFNLEAFSGLTSKPSWSAEIIQKKLPPNEISNLTKIDIKELYEIIFKLEMKNIVMNIKENFYTLN